MRLLFYSTCLAVVATPGLASEADKRASLAASFASVVNEGGSLDQFGFQPTLTPAELKSISSLAGCVPDIAEGSHSSSIKFDWTCQADPEAERQTALKFSPEGTTTLWVNPLERKMSPTPVASGSGKLPGYRSIASSFARAVKAGEDPTLGGLIPVTVESLTRLAELKGLSYTSTTGNSKSSQTMFWDLAGRVLPSPVATDIRFDEEGRPIGLILSSTSRVP